ncbi:MAG: PP2C family protein-serine/threonine phosphatase, partial [Acidobacteriota bacterium]
VTALSLEREFTPEFNKAFEARRGKSEKFFSGAEVVVIFLSVLLVAIFYFIGMALKRVQHRLGMMFLAVTSVWVLAVSALTSLGDDVRDEVNIPGHYWLSRIVPWLLMILLALLISGSLYFFWTAGQALAIVRQRQRIISLELILKGKILTRPVARSFAVGLLAGGIIVAIPALVAASRLFPGIEIDPNGMQDHLIGRFPAFSTFTGAEQYLFFIIFGFFAPLISSFIKRPLLERLLIFLICACGVLGTIFVRFSAAGLLVSGLLVAMVSTIVYLREGVLAALLSQVGAQAALGAATLLAQPAASLQSSGWRAIAGLAVTGIVSLIGVWKFREVTEEETAIPAHLLETRIERERLKAEFNVAQRAQQQMLPNAPPQIPGFDIAAICKPSKEVGGDLYDFLSLSDGRLGIVVADVSGKGVPASLYMTLTKGLLVSVAETADDPGEILREVNRHLYEVCRRKMFVTLFLGVIDPATKQLTYARAGHNPTVFRSVARQETSLLKPRGMGLGLNGGKIFDQSLKVETLQLELNDKLFFYSDGITEAMNPKNEEYGEERLIAMAEKADGMAASEARDVVLADVTNFLGSNQPQDDQTLVVVKVI